MHPHIIPQRPIHIFVSKTTREITFPIYIDMYTLGFPIKLLNGLSVINPQNMLWAFVDRYGYMAYFGGNLNFIQTPSFEGNFRDRLF